ncbi:TonB-dependent receptor [Flavobacterium sp. RHBU_3]|uniref:TonB-dependent receptor n=1 Tax=Flavobacterium sp. RHBU_3 TaxID=3391184 RepID=UPI0039848133
MAQETIRQKTDNESIKNNTSHIREMEEVVISNFHVNDSLLNVPSAISIITNMQRNNNTEIAPLLNTLPGVQMQSGALNTNRISIRGIGARTTYGTNKIRAFYGNIPLTTGDSETTIEDIDLEAINRIEIIKGPFSSIYGAGLGGAILIDPKYTSNTGHTGKASITAGSFGLLKNTFNYGYNSNNGSVNINYHKLQNDGWRTNSGYYREGATLAGDLFRKEKSRLTYFGNYTYMKAYIASSVTKESFNQDPRAAAPTWAASKGYEQYHTFMGGVSYEFELTPNLKNATSVFINNKNSYEPRPFNILAQNSMGYGGRTQFNGNSLIGKLKTEYIAGLEFFKDGYTGSTHESLYQDNNGSGSVQGAKLTGDEQSRHFINAFAQVRLQFTTKLEAQAGINYNKTTFSLDTTFPEESRNSENHSYKGIVAPQFALLYKPEKNSTVYASVSRGFSLPAISETLNADGTVNPNIKPENGYNFEIGSKTYAFNNRLYTDVALYRMEIKDLLVAQRVGDDQYVGTNAGKTLHEGIEWFIKYNQPLAKNWQLSPYVALSAGRYRFEEFISNDIDYSGNKLTGVPSTKFNAGLTLNMPLAFYITADYYYTDGIPMNDANTAFSKSDNLLNTKLGWNYNDNNGLNIGASFGINNTTNTHYASMILVNATGNNPRYYYPGLPVNYYGNVNISYLF